MMDEAKAMLAALLGVAVDKLPLTLDVETAGKAIGLGSRSRAYAAAKDGSIPIIEVAGRQRVPTVPLLRQMSGDAA